MEDTDDTYKHTDDTFKGLPMAVWTVDEVCAWLEGLELGELAPAFRANAGSAANACMRSRRARGMPELAIALQLLALPCACVPGVRHLVPCSVAAPPAPSKRSLAHTQWRMHPRMQ